MYDSILRFCQSGIVKIENACTDFFESPTDISKFVVDIRDLVLELGTGIIGDAFKELDQLIRESGERKKGWEIIRKDEKALLTSIGETRFPKTLYKNKQSGERLYLLDKVMGLEKNVRMTEDAEAAMLKEAVETSYRRAGEAASLTDSISKSTVKNKLHSLKFPEDDLDFTKKKTVRYLYIDADEDHVPLQFLEQKGDLGELFRGRKNNKALAKLAYVYEGIEGESPRSKRHRLIDPYYFSGTYEGNRNEELWERIYSYIDAKYDLDSVEQIYLNADGGGWIKGGKGKISGIVTVLDEHHINKYLVSMTSHMHDSADDGKNLLRETIRKGTKRDFEEATELMLSFAEDGNTEKRIKDASKYLLSNWTAAKTRLQKSNGVIGSSTEGHVSHVLASRMSSRPMGWSKTGVDKMAQLRAYYWNGGDMLDLVRYQKEPKENSIELKDILTLEELNKWERRHSIPSGKYIEKIQVSPSAAARKKLAIREHLMI